MKRCARCGEMVPDEEITVVDGQEVCDDCSLYLSMQKTVTPCDDNSGLKYAKHSAKKPS